VTAGHAEALQKHLAKAVKTIVQGKQEAAYIRVQSSQLPMQVQYIATSSHATMQQQQVLRWQQRQCIHAYASMKATAHRVFASINNDYHYK